MGRLRRATRPTGAPGLAWDPDQPAPLGRHADDRPAGTALLRGQVAIALITLAAAAIALVGIGDESLWLDEATSVAFARMDLSDFWPYAAGSEINASLYYLLLRGWVLLGSSEAWVRTLSAIFAIATIPIVHSLAGRLFGRRTAVVAALFLATNPFFVQYAQEARAYSLALLLVCASSLLLVLALERPTVFHWAAYAAVTTASLYSHLFAGFVILAQLVAVLVASGPLPAKRAMMVAVAAVAIATIPILLVALAPGGSFLGWIDPTSLDRVVRVAVVLTGDHKVLTAAYAALVLLAAVAALQAWRTGGPARFALLFSFAWLLTAPLAVLAASPFKPLLHSRYLIVILPALAILAAVGSTRLRWASLTALVVAGVVAVSGLRLVDQAVTPAKEDWRAATAFVLERRADEDGILFMVSSGAKPFEYYVEHMDAADRAPRAIYPRVTWGVANSLVAQQVTLEAALAEVGRDRRVWLVITHEDGREALLDSVLGSLGAAYVQGETGAFRGIEIRLYERPVAAAPAGPAALSGGGDPSGWG